MDNRYHIEITARKTGQRADDGFLRGSFDTSLGILAALGGSDDKGSAFVCALIADGDRPIPRSEVHHLVDAVFQLFGEFTKSPADAADLTAAISAAFVGFLYAHTPNEAAARAILAALPMLAEETR